MPACGFGQASAFHARGHPSRLSGFPRVANGLMRGRVSICRRPRSVCHSGAGRGRCSRRATLGRALLPGSGDKSVSPSSAGPRGGEARPFAETSRARGPGGGSGRGRRSRSPGWFPASPPRAAAALLSRGRRLQLPPRRAAIRRQTPRASPAWERPGSSRRQVGRPTSVSHRLGSAAAFALEPSKGRTWLASRGGFGWRPPRRTFSARPPPRQRADTRPKAAARARAEKAAAGPRVLPASPRGQQQLRDRDPSPSRARRHPLAFCAKLPYKVVGDPGNVPTF